jgi:hypothetical protein
MAGQQQGCIDGWDDVALGHEWDENQVRPACPGRRCLSLLHLLPYLAMNMIAPVLLGRPGQLVLVAFLLKASCSPAPTFWPGRVSPTEYTPN